MTVSSFLYNAHVEADNSSFMHGEIVFFRIMKPICATQTANVKINEGF